MRNVLIITPFFSPNIGGVETRFLDICDELDKAGYSVTVLTYQPLITKARGLPKEKKGRVTIRRYWWIGFDLFHKLKPFPVLQILYICPVLFVMSLLLLIRNNRIDVIHTAGFNAALIGRVLRLIFRKRWVVTTHAIYGLKKKSLNGFMLRFILGAADRILTLSEPSRQELIGIGIDGNKLINQITWVNQEIFKPLDRQICRKETECDGAFLVLFVGRLLPIKGIEDLVAVAKETGFIDYLFIGDGPLASYLRKEASLSENIHFLHRIDNKQLPIYYNSADISVMPSQYAEGLGRVAVESLYCGTPVIASNLGGISQLLNESVSVLIKPTTENIKSAILYLYNHPDELSKMRISCRSFALQRFGVENFRVIRDAYSLN